MTDPQLDATRAALAALNELLDVWPAVGASDTKFAAMLQARKAMIAAVVEAYDAVEAEAPSDTEEELPFP